MKNNWKSIITFTMALTMCTSLAGCGKSDNGDSGNSGSGKNKKTGTFYDTLDSEWDKSGDTTFVKLNVTEEYFDNRSFIYNNGNIYFSNNNGNEATLYCFDLNDMATKELVTIDSGNVNNRSIYFCDGFFYDYHENGNTFAITKYDLNGEEIGSSTDISSTYTFKCVTNDGYIFLSNNGSCKIIYPDMTTLKDLNDVKIPDSHGNEIALKDLTLEGSFNNKSYFYVTYENNDNGFAVFDTSSMEWSITECSFNKSYDTKSVGKYLLSTKYVVDMEKDEYLASDVSMICDVSKSTGNKIPEDYLGNSYFGGNYCIVKTDDDNFGTVAFEEGVEETLDSNVNVLGDRDLLYSRVNDKYFIFADKSGYYLREYTNGDTDIATVLLNN